MLRRVTWRSWAVLAVVAGAYTGLGWWLRGDGAVEEQLYKWGLLGTSITPFALIAVYTASGNRWWQNDLGSILVQIKLCIALLAGPLAWVFFVDHGMLLPGWVAWIEVSAPALVSLALLRLCWVFWRIHRNGSRGEGQ